MSLPTKYDCLILLCGGVFRTPQGAYLPTTYEHNDQFGMLGGHMRVVAAALTVLAGQTGTVIISSGTSEKSKTKFGAGVPSEAQVYRESLERILRELEPVEPMLHMLPHIILEEASPNTVGNIRECLALIQYHGWKHIAILSANLHTPRVTALTNLLTQNFPTDAKITFLGAEDVVKALRPGIYDLEIDEAHASPEAQKRAHSEAQGLRDIQHGNYVFTEFQSERRHRAN